jgi:trk system potassium uptake protein TrkH
MKALPPIIFFNSYVLLIVGVASLIPLIFSFTDNDFIDEYFFLTMSAACLASGILGIKLNSDKLNNISTLQIYLITTSCWLLLGILGSLPFIWGFESLSIADAMFESFSGITTTGSTVLANIEHLPRALLMWRGLLQWIGGVGIVVLSISVLPYLRVGGMKLFSSESSEWTGKSHPRSHSMVASILKVYVLLTVTCVAMYFIGGMSIFDAVVHAMTTLSTGGYSNYDDSFGHFADKPIIIWGASLFMILGALPFVFYIDIARGRPTHNLLSGQIKGFLVFLTIVIGVLCLYRYSSIDLTVFKTISQVTFNVISVVTTTGFASTDYTVWGDFAVMFFFFLMFIGGCSGSTSGSIKIFRFQLAYLMLRNQLKQMTYPNGVFALKYGGHNVTDDIIRSVIAYSMLFALSIAIIAIALTLFGLDFVTSFSAATTAVTNVGPGLGNIIGPSGNFSTLTDPAKGLLCIGMLIWRLEIMTVIILFTPGIWKK